MRLPFIFAAVLLFALMLRLRSLSRAEPVELQAARLASALPPEPSPSPPLRLAPLRASGSSPLG